MSEAVDAVALTQALVRLDTSNPPGNERAAIEMVAGLLCSSGFAATTHEFAPGRPSLVARCGRSGGRPLCLTGHIDTVPSGTKPWSVAPFGGEILEGRLYGRGSSDMKAGVAAIVSAAVACADQIRDTAGVVLVITASEETGCQGAAALVRDGVDLGRPGAMVVGEPSANRPLVGHKGALWLRLRHGGVSAHGSMPDRGVNAVYKAARTVSRIEDFGFNRKPHEVLGSPTVSVGTFHGGGNINVVPDFAEVGVDIRTVPGMVHAAVREDFLAYLGPEVEDSETVVDLPSVFTDPGEPWVRRVFEIAAQRLATAPSPAGASYFTDACELQAACPGAPIVVLGPGQPEMAHQTDEYCEVARITEAVELYRAIITDWCAPDREAEPARAP